MSIEDRNLKPGTTLVARYKGKDHTCEVVKTKDGIVYRLKDGQEFKSPSSAGSAVMGGNACNGWRFWSTADAKKGASPKASKAPAKKAKALRTIKAMDDQTETPEGQTRFWCSACMDAFIAPAGLEPIGCPNGNPAKASND